MSVRLILRFNERPSHALTTAEPWTRWLVETESPSGRGHIIGKELTLRKTTNALNVITGIEVEQLQSDPTQAQRYLDACDWWLRRAPFGVDRLPVKVVAHEHREALVRTDGWRVNAWDLHMSSQLSEINTIVALSQGLRELILSNTELTDLTPLRTASRLEILDLNDCLYLSELGPLQYCCELRVLIISCTSVSDLSPLRGLRFLTVLKANFCHDIQDLSPLQQCHDLRLLHVFSTKVSDLCPLASLGSLQEVDCGRTDVTTVEGLSSCTRLTSANFRDCLSLTSLSGFAGADSAQGVGLCSRKVGVPPTPSALTSLKEVSCFGCWALSDLSVLGDATALEQIEVSYSAADTFAWANGCVNLKKVKCVGCSSLTDLSGLAGIATLEEIDARDSAVTNTQGLEACPKLVVLNLHGSPSAHMSRGV